MNRPRSTAGQSVIETLFALPLLILFLHLLVGSLTLLSLRIQLRFLTTELAACAQSTVPLPTCRARARAQASSALGRFGISAPSTQARVDGRRAEIRASFRWAGFAIDWRLHEYNIPY